MTRAVFPGGANDGYVSVVRWWGWASVVARVMAGTRVPCTTTARVAASAPQDPQLHKEFAQELELRDLEPTEISTVDFRRRRTYHTGHCGVPVRF